MIAKSKYNSFIGQTPKVVPVYEPATILLNSQFDVLSQHFY